MGESVLRSWLAAWFLDRTSCCGSCRTDCSVRCWKGLPTGINKVPLAAHLSQNEECSFLEPDRHRTAATAKVTPAVGIGGDPVGDMPSDVGERDVGPEGIHPFVPVRAVGQDNRHRTGMFGCAEADPSNGIGVIEVVMLIAET